MTPDLVKFKQLLNIRNVFGRKETVNKCLDKYVKSSFDRFWLDQINNVRLDKEGNDRNKLRFYKKLKGSFNTEPYVTNVKNRSQRAWLSRYRVSSVANLRVEAGRHTRPVTPFDKRTCYYCSSNSIDDEMHAILICNATSIKRNCFLGKMSSLNPNFQNLSPTDKLSTILCPKNYESAICVSKYLGIISETRKKLDNGLSEDMLGCYTKH